MTVPVGTMTLGLMSGHKANRIMSSVTNLRMARKAAKRRADAQRAAHNRLVHGRSKAERALARAQDEKATSDLDRHRIAEKDGG